MINLIRKSGGICELENLFKESCLISTEDDFIGRYSLYVFISQNLLRPCSHGYFKIHYTIELFFRGLDTKSLLFPIDPATFLSTPT